MTELMFKLRRSPRTLLERDGHPGPGPGRLALVMARAGVGKTAFLVGIGVDALLSEQRVLHVTVGRPVAKVRAWYDDVLLEMLRRERVLEHWAAIQLEAERRRNIHSYMDETFSAAKLARVVELLGEAMDFKPDVIIIDHLRLTAEEPETIAALREVAVAAGAELWMACRTHRDGPQGEAGHLPPPADRFEDLVDLAFRLDPQDNTKVRLHVLKDRQQMIGRDLNIVLDPETLLLSTGVGAVR